MKLIMLPLLFSLAVIGFENRDKIMDQYNAAYPCDPVKQAALQDCTARHPNFNRLDADDRHACYTGTWGKIAPLALAPVASPYYAYSPSHLAGNDIRRQESNATYRFAVEQSTPAPAVASVHAVAAPQRPVAAHRISSQHPHNHKTPLSDRQALHV